MKLALRRRFKSPAFALTAIVTVGAASGANALIFSVVNGIILKPLQQSAGTAAVRRQPVRPAHLLTIDGARFDGAAAI